MHNGKQNAALGGNASGGTIQGRGHTQGSRNSHSSAAGQSQFDRRNDGYTNHGNQGQHLDYGNAYTHNVTYIDGYTAIPVDLFKRLEDFAGQDRGVHVPKKKHNGESVLLHTGVF